MPHFYQRCYLYYVKLLLFCMQITVFEYLEIDFLLLGNYTTPSWIWKIYETLLLWQTVYDLYVLNFFQIFSSGIFFENLILVTIQLFNNNYFYLAYT